MAASQHAFDEVPAIVEVPMASFEQDLEDDDDEFIDDLPTIPSIANQHLSTNIMSTTTTTAVASDEWTCKKCTLVNSQRVKACVVCGGSRLRSISAVEDMTLRKGEFWSCATCTLKNSLLSTACSACKAVRQVPVISGQQTNFRPYTSHPVQPNQKPVSYNHHHNRSIMASMTSNSGAAVTSTANSNFAALQQSAAASPAVSANGMPVAPNNCLAPPTHRVSRSPSPKHDRTASGAVPKVCY